MEDNSKNTNLNTSGPTTRRPEQRDFYNWFSWWQRNIKPDADEDTAYLIYSTFYDCYCQSCKQRKRLGVMPVRMGPTCVLLPAQDAQTLSIYTVQHIEEQLRIAYEDRITPSPSELWRRSFTHGKA